MGWPIATAVIVVAAIAGIAYVRAVEARVEIARSEERAAHDKLLTARIDAVVREVDVSEIV